MSVSRVAMGGTALRDRNRDKPRRHRLGLLLILSLGVGGMAGIFAFAIIWMPTLFGVFHTTSTPPQIEASLLFPSPAPIQRTITIVDPPVYSSTFHHGDDGGGGVDN